ncbi:tripartite tricarboxylate transporter TctB family protein [Mycolicibacterium sp.]|uniref:tripartite tricarboxylate transporter TctB family protein n=1 Tax=Mycolicibacterium sp. TaxID=2320850 RepID=UPI0037C98724
MTFARVRRPSEFLVVGVLAGLAALLLWDTLTAPKQAMERGPLGPSAFPIMVGCMLLACAVGIAVDLLRGGQGEPEEGSVEDRSDWVTWAVILGAVLLVAVAVEPLGWVLAGGAMFYLCVYAFGSRKHIRDLVVSTVMALGSFYFFYSVLGINLPAGVLEGIL